MTTGTKLSVMRMCEMAGFSRAGYYRLLDPTIIRNRMKIEAAVRNARALLAIQDEFGSLNAYCWRFVEGDPGSTGGRQ